MCELVKSIKDEITNIENEETDVKNELSDIYEPAEPALLNLPVEIILKICSFLDAQFLTNTLSKVCKRFEDILNDHHLWKFWVLSKLNGYYPVIPDLDIFEEEPIEWQDVCVDMDAERKKWCNVKDTMTHVVAKDVHFASVDTVLLVNNGKICISGGRDRDMALWNVGDIKPKEPSDGGPTLSDTKPLHVRHDAHLGWVWDLAADNMDNASIIYSASWDNTVKAWDLESGFNCVQTFKCGMSALSVVTSQDLVLAGLYSKKILSFDIRAGTGAVNSYKPHKGPVLALSTFKHMVASVSEDKSLAIWDQVAGKLIVSDVKMPTDKSYPVCISWSNLGLYVGDSKGSVHLFNPERFKYLRSHEIWPEPPIIKPSSKITSCYQSKGSLIVCSDRGEIKFLYNSNPPQEYTTVKTSTFDVTQLRYQNGVLVIGTCDSALEFWIPNEKYCDYIL